MTTDAQPGRRQYPQGRHVDLLKARAEAAGIAPPALLPPGELEPRVPGPPPGDPVADLEYLAGWVRGGRRADARVVSVPVDVLDRVLLRAREDGVAAERAAHPLRVIGAQAATIPGARATDPATSHAARAISEPKARNMLGRLLLAFLRRERVTAKAAENAAAAGDTLPWDATLTSEEAAQQAGIDMRSEYAKRCSELAALGLIRVAKDAAGHDRTRAGASGLQRLVYELTDEGRVKARGIEVVAL